MRVLGKLGSVWWVYSLKLRAQGLVSSLSLVRVQPQTYYEERCNACTVFHTEKAFQLIACRWNGRAKVIYDKPM